MSTDALGRDTWGIVVGVRAGTGPKGYVPSNIAYSTNNQQRTAPAPALVSERAI